MGWGGRIQQASKADTTGAASVCKEKQSPPAGHLRMMWKLPGHSQLKAWRNGEEEVGGSRCPSVTVTTGSSSVQPAEADGAW